MPCVLRVAGRGFDVDAYIRRGKLVPVAVYRRGEARFPTLPRARKSTESGFHIVISKKELADFAGQARDAVVFLGHHRRAIRALCGRKGVETALLDFQVEWGKEAVQVQLFPVELVRLAGKLGVGLQLSLYPEADARS
jgi:hypothetical protein